MAVSGGVRVACFEMYEHRATDSVTVLWTIVQIFSETSAARELSPPNGDARPLLVQHQLIGGFRQLHIADLLQILDQRQRFIRIEHSGDLQAGKAGIIDADLL